jgi:hypothetical protein
MTANHPSYEFIAATMFLAKKEYRSAFGSIRMYCYILPHLRKESVTLNRILGLWRNISETAFIVRVVLPQR